MYLCLVSNCALKLGGHILVRSDNRIACEVEPSTLHVGVQVWLAITHQCCPLHGAASRHTAFMLCVRSYTNQSCSARVRGPLTDMLFISGASSAATCKVARKRHRSDHIRDGRAIVCIEAIMPDPGPR
ncbi:hypothetical protein MRB53_038794 [Persea americana]|nr:hypothetical protein MRB53_038794 [Persea americana]